MGYDSSFTGHFDLDKKLTNEHAEYLQMFAKTRRMKRNAVLTEKRPDPVRIAAGLPVGIDGGYFVGEGGSMGQGTCWGDRKEMYDLLEYNTPPDGQPSLWCQWVPTEDGQGIEWDGGEKFYAYVEWLEYLVEHFLEPWGYKLTGEIAWQGEESADQGIIYAKDNEIEAHNSTISTPLPSWEQKAKKGRKRS